MENTLNTPKTHNLPTSTLRLESPPKLLFDCLILILVGFVGYQFGHNNGHNTGKSSLTPLVEEREQQVKEKNQQILGKDALIATLEHQLKAYKEADASALTFSDPKPTLTNNLQRVPVRPSPDGGNKPDSVPGIDGLPPQPDLDTPTPPGGLIIPQPPAFEPALNDDMEQRLFRSLQSEASGVRRIDDRVEGILATQLSRLEDNHNSVMKNWETLSDDHAEKKRLAGRVLESLRGIKTDKSKEITEEEQKSLMETLIKQNESLKQEYGDLYADILRHEGILANSTNQIVAAEQVLEDFKASRLKFDTDRTAAQKRIKEAQAEDLQKLSEASAQINSLNLETGSLEDKIKALSDGYSLHVTLGSASWATDVFKEAKEHAARIPDKIKSLLDEAIVAQGKLERELEGKDGELTVAEKNLVSLRESEVILEGLILEGLIPEGGVEKARQAVEAKKEKVRTNIGLLNDEKNALTISQGENEGVRTKLEADHSKAVKERDDALANIESNKIKFEGLFTNPIELEPSPTLIGALESELSITTNNLNIVGTLINNRETKLKEDTAKLEDFESKKKKLEELTKGEGAIKEKLAAFHEIVAIEKQLKGLQAVIEAIDLQLAKKKVENSSLLDTQDRLKKLLAFLKPDYDTPVPPNKIVLVPQGDNILECAFIVKPVPLINNNRIFGGRSSEYSKFLKFHKEQVTRLQNTMPAVNYLKEGSGVTDSENNDERLDELVANALIESSQILGGSEATLEATGLSGKLIVYGYARSESGTMKIYVRELDSTPARVPLEHGIDPDFSFLKKK